MDILKNISINLGKVVLTSQTMEFKISLILSIEDNLGCEKDGDKLIYQSLDIFSKRTFGLLIKRFKQKVPLSDPEVEILREALEQRNYLIHNILKENLADLLNEKNQKEFLLKIKDSVKKIDRGHALIDIILNGIMEAMGMDIEAMKNTPIQTFDIEKHNKLLNRERQKQASP